MIKITLVLPLLLLTCTSCSGLREKTAAYELPSFTAEEAKALGLGDTLEYIDRSRNPSEFLVQLRCRRSFIVESLAIHPWFLIFDPELDRWDEWDIYALRDARYEREEHTIEVPTVDGQSKETVAWATQTWGHVDTLENKLFDPKRGLVLTEWRGEQARAIIEVLRRPEDYPHRDTYRYWPGPNSNTYVAWVLRQAGISGDMHPLAVGKDYLGFYGIGAWYTTTHTGLQVESPLVGLKFGILDGVELHLLGLTLGLDLCPPALKTPLGRFGMQE